MLPPKCLTVRDGKVHEIEAKELVPGDVVKLETGNKVPADLRIFWVNGLKVDQSSITGEVDPIEITVKSQHSLELESKNITFNSCLILEG